MHDESAVPKLMIVRVLTPGGPFAPGHMLSVAFDAPTIARLVAHETETGASERRDALVPESISARVTVAADPYRTDEVVTLSFVDPRFARIHPATDDRERRPLAPEPARATTVAVAPATPERFERTSVEASAGVRVRLGWNTDGARRFVHVVDKLFTVDRLGWYRHVFAMRLLVPDAIDCGDAIGTTEATRHLQLLRAATTETLGRPLIAAFMPNFTVTPEWLETIDSPAIARALGDLRATVAPFVSNDVGPAASECVGDVSIGLLTREDLVGAASSSVDAFLPALVPNYSANVALADRLTAYRSALADVFAQTARSAEAVRLGRMSEPNHVLDDRLWQLVGTVGSTLGALAVA